MTRICGYTFRPVGLSTYEASAVDLRTGVRDTVRLWRKGRTWHCTLRRGGIEWRGRGRTRYDAVDETLRQMAMERAA